MITTVKDVRRWIEDMPDDAEVWIEYPKRYGLAQPEKILVLGRGDDSSDMIQSLTIGKAADNSKLHIFHHYLVKPRPYVTVGIQFHNIFCF